MTRPKHASQWPTTGAVILSLILAIGFGILALIGQFKQARTHRNLRADEQCQAQVFQENLNRARILARLSEERDAAQYALDARWARDVFLLNHGQTAAGADIPKAYEALRSKVAAINAEQAAQGALLSATEPPPGCRLPLTTAPGSTPPSLSIPTGRTTRPRATSTTTLPPLPNIVILRFTTTATVFIHGRDILIPGPRTTVTIHMRPVRTKTVTVTVTARPTPTRVVPLRTKTH